MQFCPPDYLRRAIKSYRQASESCVSATIALAMATAKYSADLSEENAEKAVANKVADLVEAPDLRSRLLDIAALADEALKQGMTLENIKSQGVLFAVVAARNARKKSGEQVDWKELLDDAKTLTIAKFRAKWNKSEPESPGTQNPANSVAPTVDVKTIVDWLKHAPLKDIRAVVKAANRRLRRTARV